MWDHLCTLLLPMVEEFSDPYYVLSIFNKFLTSLLLGGEYCEAILPEDLGVGLIDSNNRAMIITGIERWSHMFEQLKAYL